LHYYIFHLTHPGVLFMKNKNSNSPTRKKEMFSDKSFLYTQQRTRRKNANANAKDSRFSRQIRNACEKSLQMVAPSVV